MSIWRKDTKQNAKRRRGAASRASQTRRAQPHRTGRRRLQCEALESRIVLSGSGAGDPLTFDDSVISTVEGGGISFDLDDYGDSVSVTAQFAVATSLNITLSDRSYSGASYQLRVAGETASFSVIFSGANDAMQQISLSPLASPQEGGEIGFAEYQNSGTSLAPFGGGSLAENGAARESQEEGLFNFSNQSLGSGISGGLGRANPLEVASHSGSQSSSLRTASSRLTLSGPFGARSDFSQQAEGVNAATVSKQTFHAQFAADSRLTDKATAEPTGPYARDAQQTAESTPEVNIIASDSSEHASRLSYPAQATEVVFTQVGGEPNAKRGAASQQLATDSNLNAETHTAATGAVFAHWEDEPSGVLAAARGLTENKTQEGENWSFVVVLVAAHLAVDRFARHGDETKQRPPE